MSERKNVEMLLPMAAFVLVLGLCAAARGEVIYVDAGATGANDGSSWVDGYCCLQDALVNARPRDEIHVAKGVYRPDRQTEMTAGETLIIASGHRTATFQLVNDVRIMGGYAGYGESNPDLRDIELYETVLSGDLDANDVDVSSLDELLNEPSRADNSYQIVTGSGTGATAVLDGFTITAGNASVYTHRDGGGLVNEYGSPQIINCTFIANSARSYGAGIYNYYSNPTLLDCAFIGNSGRGGVYNYQSHPILVNCEFFRNSYKAMHNVRSNPDLTDCTFTENVDIAMSCDDSNPNLTGCIFIRNSADRSGGAISCNSSDPILTDCIFIENSADYSGGAIFCSSSDPILNNCTFIENSAGYGGAMHNASGSTPILNNCTLTGNSARDYGGAMYNTGDTVTLNNCILNANSAHTYGGATSCNSCDMILTNCTLVGNSARDGGTFAFNSSKQRGRSDVSLINCILRNSDGAIWILDNSDVSISYSNIQGGWPGEGNIDADPLFADPEGPDGVGGNQDDDLRLAPLSLCVDAGLQGYELPPDQTEDIDGNPRIVSGLIDMGAYEFQGLTYVDDDASGNPLANGTEHNPLGGIQQAIDIARDGYKVLVKPGIYDKIDFRGKAITVAGIAGAPVIEASTAGQADNLGLDAVTFHAGEDRSSVLRNFVIANSGMAISLNSGSSPTISNLTIVANDFGIAAYENSNPDISNCIFWNNRDGDLFQCQARYSRVEDTAPGEGNISVDPLFVDGANGDYHLKSEGWRWDMQNGLWTFDQNTTSLCIDAGSPAFLLGDEPMSVPLDPDNIYGVNRRINMGAFGGTSEASMPPPGWVLPEDRAVALETVLFQQSVE